MTVRLIVVLSAVFALAPVVARAQPLPVTPDPAECTVEPRPVAFFESLVADLGAATPAATPIVDRSVEEAGEPADAETEAEVVDLLRQGIACTNAGDFPRLAALLTDEAARDAVLAGWGRGVRAIRDAAESSGREPLSDRAVLALITRSGPPLPAGSRGGLVAVRQVRELPDGRVAAVAVRTLADGGEVETRVAFARDEGRFRIAEETALVLRGTPIP